MALWLLLLRMTAEKVLKVLKILIMLEDQC